MGFSATDIIEASEKALNSETPEIKKLAGKVVDVGDIVIDTVKTVLLPIVAVNYYAKKAEVYFKGSFENVTNHLILEIDNRLGLKLN